MPRTDLTIYPREPIGARCVYLPGSTPEPDDWMLSLFPAAQGEPYQVEHIVNLWGSPAKLRGVVRELVLALEAAGVLPQPAAVTIRAILDGVDVEAGVPLEPDPEMRALDYALKRNAGGA